MRKDKCQIPDCRKTAQFNCEIQTPRMNVKLCPSCSLKFFPQDKEYINASVKKWSKKYENNN